MLNQHVSKHFYYHGTELLGGLLVYRPSARGAWSAGPAGRPVRRPLYACVLTAHSTPPRRPVRCALAFTGPAPSAPVCAAHVWTQHTYRQNAAAHAAQRPCLSHKDANQQVNNSTHLALYVGTSRTVAFGPFVCIVIQFATFDVAQLL